MNGGPHTEILQSLLRRLDEEIQKVSSSSRVFVKLSFMSPKDVAGRLSNVQVLCRIAHLTLKTQQNFLEAAKHLFAANEPALLREVLNGEIKSEEHKSLSISIYRAWLNSLYASLSVTNANEAIKRICASSRCFEELNDALMLPEHPELFRTCVVVRPWIAIRPGFEFRVFVSDGKITCAGQYEPVYYPEVWERRDWLQLSIRDFVTTQVIPKLYHRLPSVVIDVVMADEDERFYVCEVNPFATSTSACMFKWDTDKIPIMVGPETWRFAGPGLERFEQIPRDWRDFLARRLLPPVEDEGGDTIGTSKLLAIGAVLCVVTACFLYHKAKKQ